MDTVEDLGEDDGLIHLNGIDAATGDYLAPPMVIAEAGTRAAGRPPDAEAAGLLRRFQDALKRPFRGLPDDIAATDPASAGWAIAFAADTPPEVRAALEPLIAHRRDHTRVPADRLKVVEYPAGHTLEGWRRGLKAHAADIEPTVLPYYVTLVGGPGSIPFEHQAALDVHYAVGRLCFDRPEQYRQYAEGVIAYERLSGNFLR